MDYVRLASEADRLSAQVVKIIPREEWLPVVELLELSRDRFWALVGHQQMQEWTRPQIDALRAILLYRERSGRLPESLEAIGVSVRPHNVGFEYVHIDPRVGQPPRRVTVARVG